jgi:hypothetical protein
MTTNVVRTAGNYQIQTPDNGQIILDTGVNTGTVTITGSLNVKGTTTVIQATNATIKDNLLTLNAGETNSYVTLGTSGIVVDRGNNANLNNAASLLFNDSIGADGFTWHTTDISERGIFEFRVAGNVSAIKINAIRIDETTAPRVGGYPRLNLFGSDNPGTVLSVAGTNSYESRIIDKDDIPNKAYVDAKVENAASSANISRVFQGNTSLNINDISVTGQPSNMTLQFTPGLNSVVFTDANISFPGLIFTQNAISARGTNSDIYLQPAGTGGIYVSQNLRLVNQSTPAVATTNTTALYATGTVGAGGTGIYYVNSATSGEFISRKKAIIYGLIF